MNDTLTIDGKHTSADIKTTNVDETCIEQVQEMVDHEAFQSPVKIMPDAHAGAGAVVGFTMPLGNRIVPNTVGVDIGCGMTAYRLGERESSDLEWFIEERAREADERIRNAVPLGYNTFGDVDVDQDFHMHDDFPWEVCTEKARQFNRAVADRDDLDIPQLDDYYGPEYFDQLCETIEYDPMRAINSIGTLGGGNHFIEVSRSKESGDYFVVVHSGSRGIGLSIAEYWQERAHENCDGRADEVRDRLADLPDWSYKFDLDEVTDAELLNWLQGGMGEDWKHPEAIRHHVDGERIGEIINELKSIAQYVRDNSGGDDLDYLDGSNRAGYLKDMIFAQTYAHVSRQRMCDAVARALGASVDTEINSTHNYIDFEDLIIRKGATRVHLEEIGIIPFNMRDGAVIVKGRGNEDWHQSAPHGAGRRGSRTWAESEFSVAEYAKEMEGVFSTSVNENTLDEAPMAYKDTNDILERLQETAFVLDELVPRINIKAE